MREAGVWSVRLALFTLAVSCTGCGSDDEPDSVGDMEWGACPSGYGSECARLTLPLDWNDPQGEKLRVLLMRYRKLRAGDASAPQLWFLAGGPGQSMASFTEAFPVLHELLPEFDFYSLEHRGVGASGAFACAALGSSLNVPETGNVELCGDELAATHGEQLAFYTTTAAARDLDAVLRAAADGSEQHVWAGSYGTYWAQRFMQIAVPPGAVVLDSLLSPEQRFLSRYDEGFEPVVKALATLCDADPTCQSHLGQPAWTFLEALLDKAASGHCPELGAGTTELGPAIGSFAANSVLRELLFPMFYRYDRCGADDIAAWASLSAALSEDSDSMSSGRNSQALQLHVSYSELWEEPSPSATEIAERRARHRIWLGFLDEAAPAHESWPRYAADEFVGLWPQFSTPVLALNGDLDAQTTYEQAATIAEHLNGDDQHFVKVPYASHGAGFSSLCSVELLHSFLVAPDAPLDDACLTELPPPDLSGKGVSQALLGTPDAWDGVSVGASASIEPTAAGRMRQPIDWRRLIARVKSLAIMPRSARLGGR